MKVSQVYFITRRELEQIGITDPDGEARFITSWICNIPAGRISLSGDTEVEGVAKELEDILSRRRKREPLQLIFGKWEFFSREFMLTRGVHVPRPETEILIEVVLDRLQVCGSNHVRGLEVGSGAGNICVTLLAEMENMQLVAIDVSEDAVMLTEKNAAMHGVSERIEIELGDFKSYFQDGTVFDFIVSNPPYLSKKDFFHTLPEVKEYEPETALVGGETGMECIEDLLRCAGKLLVPGGLLFFEFGLGQKERVRNIIGDDRKFEKCEIIDDLALIPRVAITRRVG